jgi:multicomponent Na+:H+ antiporter subunit D
VILISSLLNAVYFFRILEKIYMKNPEAEEQVPDEGLVSNEVKPSMLYPTSIFAAGLFLIGIFNVAIVAVIMNMFPAGL